MQPLPLLTFVLFTAGGRRLWMDPVNHQPEGAAKRTKSPRFGLFATTIASSSLGNVQNATTMSLQYERQIPHRPLAPPYPDGPCGGRLLTIPPEELNSFLHNNNNNNNNNNKGTHDANNGETTDWRTHVPFVGSLWSGTKKTTTSAKILPPRSIQIWLPPSYDDSTKQKHRILLVHDGQNALQDASSWTGSSWRLAGALVRLAERQLLITSNQTTTAAIPLVVLLPSAEPPLRMPPVISRQRHLEYAGDPRQPAAQAHVEWVAETVVPWVQANFRTTSSSCSQQSNHNNSLDDPLAVCAMGTSLGGQASWHLMLEYPNLVGGVAALSPALAPSLLGWAARHPWGTVSSSCTPKRLYLDNGGDSGDVRVPWWQVQDHLTQEHWWNPGYFWLDTQLQPSLDVLTAILRWHRVPHRYRKFPGARHNERAWAQRIAEPLLYLYGQHDENENE